MRLLPPKAVYHRVFRQTCHIRRRSATLIQKKHRFFNYSLLIFSLHDLIPPHCAAV